MNPICSNYGIERQGKCLVCSYHKETLTTEKEFSKLSTGSYELVRYDDYETHTEKVYLGSLSILLGSIYGL